MHTYLPTRLNLCKVNMMILHSSFIQNCEHNLKKNQTHCCLKDTVDFYLGYASLRNG
jgi:hypothetical protein